MESEQVQETSAEVVEAPKTEKVPKAIALNEDMSLRPVNHLEFKTMISAISAGGGFPSRFKTFNAQIAAANLATSLMGSKWQLAINNIADVKGQLTIYGELPGAIAERTGQIEAKRLFCIDEEYNEICTKNKNLNKKPWAGVCQIKRSGRPANEFTYTLEEATAAGQYPAYKAEYVDNRKTGRMIDNPDSPWMKFTKVMLMRKAMNMAIKFEFPDAIVGVPIAEDQFGVAPDLDGSMKDVTPRSNIAEEMNKEFRGTNEGDLPRVPEAQGA
jgi:hypothetical protein